MSFRRIIALPGMVAAFLMSMLAANAASLADFYRVADADLAGPPGSLIRAEPMLISPAGSRGYRILYRSTGLQGEPIAVSGVVVIPKKAPPDRPLLAWAHPTTGVAAKCAPSMQADSLKKIPGIEIMISRGYVVVATDYPGLGTAGMHPYLVGVSEGRAILDSVRAVGELRDAQAGRLFGVWGHSQGGHAALFAGEIAAHYAPELTLVGVAAAAPATELADLFEANVATKAGIALTALTLTSWSEVYRVELGTVVADAATAHVGRIGTECISGGPRQLLSDLSALLKLQKNFLHADPMTTHPWDKVADLNTPGQARSGAPVFIAQGSIDKIVDPQVTVEFAKKLCGHGTPVRFFGVPQASHGMISDASAPAAMAWMQSRFVHAPPQNDCR